NGLLGSEGEGALDVAAVRRSGAADLLPRDRRPAGAAARAPGIGERQRELENVRRVRDLPLLLAEDGARTSQAHRVTALEAVVRDPFGVGCAHLGAGHAA